MTTRFLPTLRAFWILVPLLTLTPVELFAAGPRALPEGKLPDDVRLAPPKDLDGYFPFTPPATRAEWEQRAERVRRQILVSQGLYPLPTKTPLNAVIHGKVDRDEYSVEKVYFESTPGFFVTGNLYRPKNVNGKVPAVLFAHGHWTNARLTESTPAELRREIADGEERFEQGGRSRFQSMCVQLARMGCVVWQWDMLGNSDSQQLSMQLTHGFAKQRPEMNQLHGWGLFSPQAEAHLQSVMGLQTWNSIRSLDFVLSLPEVDPDRIAITGASGGGTQTMILAAIDPRVKLSFPAVMVSTAMQGGCTCENASLLRVETGNVEFAALFAPGPQGMTCANDWTKEMSVKGFPDLKKLYALYGATNNVMLKRGEHFPHNYNAVSRSAFYTWLNRHFKLGQREPVIERDYEVLPREQLTVWDAAHPAPKSDDPEFERQLLHYLDAESSKQLQAAQRDSQSFRHLVGGGIDIVLGRNLSNAGNVEWTETRKTDKGQWTESVGLLRNTSHHEEVPTVFCTPKNGNGRTTIWLSAEGKSGLFTSEGSLRPGVQKLVNAGVSVVGLDLLYQGEFLADGKPLLKTPRVKNPREAEFYTFGYNYSVFAQRVQDVVSAVKYLIAPNRAEKQLSIVALAGAGPWAAAARAQCGDSVQLAAIDTGGFRFGNVLDLHDPNFLPGGAKYGDLPGMIAMAAPGKIWLTHEVIPSQTAVATTSARSELWGVNPDAHITLYSGPPQNVESAAIDWILAAK